MSQSLFLMTRSSSILASLRRKFTKGLTIVSKIMDNIGNELTSYNVKKVKLNRNFMKLHGEWLHLYHMFISQTSFQTNSAKVIQKTTRITYHEVSLSITETSSRLSAGMMSSYVNVAAYSWSAVVLRTWREKCSFVRISHETKIFGHKNLPTALRCSCALTFNRCL